MFGVECRRCGSRNARKTGWSQPFDAPGLLAGELAENPTCGSFALVLCFVLR
jgi:hypothetical protein